ncbi:MAG: lysozyme [Bacteroidota bacterium]
MTLNLKFILITELALVLNFTGFVIKKDVKVNDEKEEKKGKKLTPIQNKEFSIRPVFDWNKQYEKTLEYIKDHEGFADGTAYICPGGHKTIGYGHIILGNEDFSQITEQQADSILRADFNKAIRVLDANIKLDGSKKLAIAHFVYAKGIGSFNRSTLKKKILKNESIDTEITKWCYYTNSKGEKVKSQHALNIRKWELDLYNFKG